MSTPRMWILILVSCFCTNFILADDKSIKKVSSSTKNNWKPVEVFLKKRTGHKDDGYYENTDFNRGYDGNGYYRQRGKDEVQELVGYRNGIYDSFENNFGERHRPFIYGRAVGSTSSSASSNSNNNNNDTPSAPNTYSSNNFNRPGNGYDSNNNNNNANANNYPYSANLNQRPADVSTVTYGVSYGPNTVTTNPDDHNNNGYDYNSFSSENTNSNYGYNNYGTGQTMDHYYGISQGSSYNTQGSSTGYEAYRPGSLDNYYYYYPYGGTPSPYSGDSSYNTYSGPNYANFGYGRTIGGLRALVPLLTSSQVGYRNAHHIRGSDSGVYKSNSPDCDKMHALSLVSYRMPLRNELNQNLGSDLNLYFV